MPRPGDSGISRPPSALRHQPSPTVGPKPEAPGPAARPGDRPGGTTRGREWGGSLREGERPGRYHSNRSRALGEKVTPEPVALADAVRQLKAFGNTKFVQTVEVSTNLGIDPRQSDQNVRGSVAVPHGIGKSLRAALFAPGENTEKATVAGAAIAGGDDPPQKTT